jgi:AcrB/AcrD/AcrF family
VRNNEGKMIPLRSLVEVRVVVGPPALIRYNNIRAVTVLGSPAPGVSSGQALKRWNRSRPRRFQRALQAELRTITVDYTVEFARVLRGSSPEATFALLSGMGADPTRRSRIAFARYKGEAENALLAAGFPNVYLFRPAYIYPVEPRREPNFSYRLLRAIYPAFRILFPNQVIRADDLARAMVDVAVRGSGERRGPIFENRDIRAMVESAGF